jgi:hypothetical protein
MLAAAWEHKAGDFTNGPDNSIIMDLEGGSYSFSRPLYFPSSGGGGLAIRDGIIRASSAFPQDDPNSTSPLALIMLTNATAGPYDGDCCWYEFIYFTNLVLDGGLRTGCVRVHTAARIVFDEIFFTGFASTGELPTCTYDINFDYADLFAVQGLYYGRPSHQLLLSRSFFGTTDWRGTKDNR